MSTGAVLIGKDAKAYWSATKIANKDDHATWLGNASLADNIMDLRAEIDSEMADATTRAEAAEGFASEIAVLKGGRVTFDIRWDPGDTFTDELIRAWDVGDGISMAFMDQDKATTGSQGLISIFSVSLQKQEALRDVQKASITLSIAKFPKWHKVTGGGP